MKPLSLYIIILCALIVALSIVNISANRENNFQKIYTGNNKIETEVTPKKLPQSKKVSGPPDIIGLIKPITASLFPENITEPPDESYEKKSTKIKSEENEKNNTQESATLLAGNGKQILGQEDSAFGGSVLSQQCGGGPGPIAGIGPTYAGVAIAYDSCNVNPPEIEPSHPYPACVSASYKCVFPCFCAPFKFTVNERDLMYPIKTDGASVFYTMTKVKCSCPPPACNVICSPRAWTWDSATGTCVCS